MANPDIMKEMPLQEVAGVTCPITLPWFYQIKAQPVAGGQTVEYYGTIATGAITLAATVISLALAWVHMTHYSKPHQQKHIIRIVWMVPVFTLISSISTLNYPSSIYLQPFQQFYEAITLISIFNLFCNYLANGFAAQLAFFEHGAYEVVQDQMKKPSGLASRIKIGTRWYKVIVILVFQFLPIEFFVTILTWITNAAGVYCATSTAPQFAHLYLFIISTISMSICLVGIVYFYKGMKPIIHHHRPLLQLACIKIIVILNGIQGEIIQILLSKHQISMSQTWSYGDITIMTPSFLLAIECLCVSIAFWWAFNPREFFLEDEVYNAEIGAVSASLSYKGGLLGIKALFQAVWMWDLVKNCYLAVKVSTSAFKPDGGAGDLAKGYSQQDFLMLSSQRSDTHSNIGRESLADTSRFSSRSLS